MQMRQRGVTPHTSGPCHRIGFLTSQELLRLGLGPLLLQERCGTSYTDQQTLFLLWSGLWLVRCALQPALLAPSIYVYLV